MVEAVWAGRHAAHEGALPEPHHLANGADPADRAAHRARERSRHLDGHRRRARAGPDRRSTCTALDVDFYGGNCHKWLCAPKGAGFLYARRELAALLEPLVVSWGWEPARPGPVAASSTSTNARAPATSAAYLAVPDAIAFQAEHDWPRVRRSATSWFASPGQMLELTGDATCSPG